MCAFSFGENLPSIGEGGSGQRNAAGPSSQGAVSPRSKQTVLMPVNLPGSGDTSECSKLINTTHKKNSQLVLGSSFQLGRCLFVLLDRSCVACVPRLSLLLICGCRAYIQACRHMPRLSECVSAVTVLLTNRGITPLSLSFCLMKGSLWSICPVNEEKTLHLELPLEDLWSALISAASSNVFCLAF